MGAHTFAPGDIVKLTGGNHGGHLAVVIAGDGCPRWDEIKDTPAAAGSVCLSLGMMSGIVEPVEHVELRTPASAITVPERVDGAVVRFTLAEFREEWGDHPCVDGDDDGGFVDYSLPEALIMLEERRTSDRRRPGDRIALAAVVVLADEEVAALTGQTPAAAPERPTVPADGPLEAGELAWVTSGGEYRDMLVRITEVTDSLAHGHHWNGSTSWRLDELERVPETAAERAAGHIPGSHDLGGPPAYFRAAALKVGDHVVVDAEHHHDHGRRGVVVSVRDAAWPIGVRVGTGIGAVVHYFREDELILDLTSEGASVLGSESGVAG